ncbi:TetR/AcrR family transcriptional regulator [Leifsonia flava]|uniref:TetR family transcriptional regulator n=1 Tax=Orlajensenia leifsoniae TaxID=2561933 RepID=A0A4Y9QWB8_9MICO|nr:TetR family transcriptional regulator [Leifsonia flava]TFV96811.1 TetR family transcriptional regulator [Leifsonia flava]
MATATGAARRREDGSTSARARLDRDSIIAAGLELAAGSGTASISVRELGAHLGADPTAIYRHFRSKDHLMQALLDELTARSLAEVTAAPSEWRERLRQLAASTLAQYVAYPAVGAEAIILTTHGPAELDAIEFMLQAFAEAGLSGEDLVRHYALMATHVLSSAAGIARGRGERDPVSGAGPWFEGPILADPRKYPLITAYSTQLTDLEDVALFTLGVEAVIQSAERTAARSG